MSAFSLNLSLLKYAVGFFSNKISNENTSHRQVLEPFSTILKLAIISFKPHGTKLAINNNKLYIQEPSLFQGTIRMAYGNNREEIHHMLKPIMRATELYPPEKNEDLKNIYKLAINGIKCLKRSYNNSSSTVCYTLDLYISILDRKVLEKSILIDSYDDYKNDDLNLADQYKIFNELWDDNDIQIVSNLFRSASKSKEAIINDSYLESIEKIIKAKEIIVDEKLKKVSNLI